MNLLYHITKKIFITIVLLFSTLSYINAQVTIGSDISPKEGALPDLNRVITNKNV